ncbi:MAG: hypothetical protein CMC55_07350 [Flavobacteriaceae bacterium]|uniref:hypothetical protein n=1 Tax=Bizionia echini TaxID=649333 RepID=UPI000C9165B5|nr:hypothetical protein [Flavobacteriaceae bacterium]|tara:strand:- start:21 stop:206 length:186 start_codon:yes stop_codon:yes gene_type:complete
MNKLWYQPKTIVITGIIICAVGLCYHFLGSKQDTFISGILIGMGFGTVFSNVFRLFNLDKI